MPCSFTPTVNSTAPRVCAALLLPLADKHLSRYKVFGFACHFPPADSALSVPARDSPTAQTLEAARMVVT